MAKQFDSVIKKLNFKGIKLNLCTKKAPYDKNIDYEFVPYDSQPVEQPLATTKNKTNPNNHMQSSMYLPNENNSVIENKENRFEENITAFRTIYNQLSSANLLASSLNQKSFMSLTKLEGMDLEPVMISNEHDNYAYDNADYSSPFQSSIVSKSTSVCSCNDCSCTGSSCSYRDSFMSKDTATASEVGANDTAQINDMNNESYFESENERLYVCCKAYKAKMDGDLSLRFTDRIKLIHQNDDIALVKNILNGKCGYVPRDCITSISEFLSEIQYFN